MTPNEILALWSWILFMGLASALSFGNTRKNRGLPLERVWRSMTLLCTWWTASAIIGLLGGPFVLLYRIGIAGAVVVVFWHYRNGDFGTRI